MPTVTICSMRPLVRLLAVIFLLGHLQSAQGFEPRVVKNIDYKSDPRFTAEEKERCTLDLYLPAQKDFATLVWFHGGGLTSGSKDEEFTVKIAKSFAKSGVAVAAVNYRLSPKAKYPAYIDDAAAAFAATLRHIGKYDGNPEKVFIGGHSAGGYLAAIVSLKEGHLAYFGLSLNDVAGSIPVSGQMMTHYTIRQERGLSKYSVIADEAAPIHYCSKDTVPMLVLYAENDLASREQENTFFVSTMKAAGNKRVRGLLIGFRNHATIAGNMANADDPAKQMVLEFIEQVSKDRVTPASN